MSIENYCEDLSTRRLAGVLEQCRNETSFFCDVLFREVITFDEEAIQWDRIYEDRSMAPFVCPCVQAPNIAGMDATDSIIFKPAYIKYKSTIEYCEPLPRLPGERCWGDLTERERFQAHLARTLQRHDQALTRTEEWMAAHALVDGFLNIVGEKYPAQHVNYKRHEDLTFESGYSLEDCDAKQCMAMLQEAYDRVWCHSDAQITDLIMTPKTCMKLKACMANEHCCDASNPFLQTSGAVGDLTARTDMQIAGARVEFTIGGVRVWCVNANMYTCGPDGVQLDKPENLIPEGKIIGLALNQPCGLRLIKAYGAIRDCGSLQPQRRYTKTWTQPDPCAEFIMTQSAPLPIILNPNASFCMDVGCGDTAGEAKKTKARSNK